MMSFKLLSKITIIVALLFMPLAAVAAEVPWSYEWYRAYATGSVGLDREVDETFTDEATGSTPPLYAGVEDSLDGVLNAWSNIESSYMETDVYAGGSAHYGGIGAYARGEFWGRYTADMPFFEISYDYDFKSFRGGGILRGMVKDRRPDKPGKSF